LSLPLLIPSKRKKKLGEALLRLLSCGLPVDEAEVRELVEKRADVNVTDEVREGGREGGLVEELFLT
jgi:hypothetical protein